MNSVEHCRFNDQLYAIIVRASFREPGISFFSPPELSQQRLKQQIQVLQSSLRSGQRQVEPQAMLMQLCAQPALLDDAAAARVERLIREAQ